MSLKYKIPSKEILHLPLSEFLKVEDDSGEYEVVIADDSVVTRYYADIQLSMSKGAADFSRVKDRVAPLLFNHNSDRPIGIVLKAWLDGNQAKARIAFRESDEFTNNLVADLNAGKLPRGLSVGIEFIKTTIQESQNQKENDRLTIDKWALLELSYAPVPAIPSVGMAEETTQDLKEVNMSTPEDNKQTEQTSAEVNKEMPTTPARDAGLVAYAESHPEHAHAAWLAYSEGMTLQEFLKSVPSPSAAPAPAPEPAPAPAPTADATSAEDAAADKFASINMSNFNYEEAAKKMSKERDFSPSLLLLHQENPHNKDRERTAALEVKLQELGGLFSGAVPKDHNTIFMPFEAFPHYGTRASAGDDFKNLGLTEFVNRNRVDIGSEKFAAITTTSGSGAIATNAMRSEFIPFFHDLNSIAPYCNILSGLTANVTLPLLTSESTPVFVAEGTTVAENSPTATSRQLSPKQMQTGAEVSLLTNIQSQGFIDTKVMENLMMSISNGLDRAILAGSGATNNPAGVHSAVTTVTWTKDTAVAWSDIAPLRYTVRKQNTPGPYVVAMGSDVHAVSTSTKHTLSLIHI